MKKIKKGYKPCKNNKIMPYKKIKYNKIKIIKYNN